MKTLFKNAKILTMKDEHISEGSLVVDNHRIIYIGNDYINYGPFDREIDCKHNLLMPGFKNAHAHSAMVFLRGKAEDLVLQDWLFKVVFPREEKLIASDVYHLNKLAYLEYLSSGITACFDHYFFPLEQAKAAEEIGMRTLLLATFDEQKLNEQQLNDVFHQYNDYKDSLVRFVVGIHAEYTSNDHLLLHTNNIIKSTNSPFFTHISETKKEVDECYARHQKSPLQYLLSQGVYTNGGGLFHGIYLSDEDIVLAKQNNISIVSCPCSNAKLASGIAPINKYIKAGINVALGTDGPASNNSLDMFKEMYMAATLQKLLLKDAQAIAPFEILKMATVNGAKVMGLKDADVLAVNKLADLILIDLKAPNMQPHNDIISHLVYSAHKGNVLLTMINGKILYEKGQYYLNETIDDIYSNAYQAIERLEKAIKK